MENALDATLRTLVEKFPLNRPVITTNVIVGSTRNGVVKGHFVDSTGEFVIVGMGRSHQMVALKPDDLRRADVEHPRCPSCECEKIPTPRARVRVPRISLDEEDDFAED